MAFWNSDPNYREAQRLQSYIMERVDDPEKRKQIAPGELASLVSSWDKIQDRKRIMRGKCKPGSYGPRDIIRQVPGQRPVIVDLLPDAETQATSTDASPPVGQGSGASEAGASQ